LSAAAFSSHGRLSSSLSCAHSLPSSLATSGKLASGWDSLTAGLLKEKEES
jgi:hypothetical protein